MKLELDIKSPLWPVDDLGYQAELLRMAEAMLRVSYFRDRMGGPDMLELIEAIRAKANELEAQQP